MLDKKHILIDEFMKYPAHPSYGEFNTHRKPNNFDKPATCKF